MSHDDSYLNARLAERRRQVRSGMAGIGLLLALGWGLLWAYPAPQGGGLLRSTTMTSTATTTAATAWQSTELDGPAATALR